MSSTVSLKLTPKQAKILWGVVDGAQDAGSCEDGLTQEEHRALERVIDQLLDQHDKWKGVKLNVPS